MSLILKVTGNVDMLAGAEEQRKEALLKRWLEEAVTDAVSRHLYNGKG